MKKQVLGAALVGLLALGGAAVAQTTFTLSAADSTKFQTWVSGQKHTSVAIPSGFNLSVGAVVPQTVELYEIPMTVGVAPVVQYRYAVIGGKTVLINPTDRKVVYIVGG